MLHEMGHAFAGLADEYVDLLALAAGSYREGMFPNVTRLTDPVQIPWRHWFQDPNNIPTTPGTPGIGLFEGAYYAPTGNYRPADESFMRTYTGPMTPVHAEAWTRSIYRRIGPIDSSAPAEAALTLEPDEQRNFTVERRFPAGVQSLRWYLDEQEVESARDAAQFTCCTGLTGSHVLRAEVLDVSGVIRAPDAAESRASRSWNIDIVDQPSSVQPGKLVPSSSEGEWVIRVRVDASGQHVEGFRAQMLRWRGGIRHCKQTILPRRFTTRSRTTQARCW